MEKETQSLDKMSREAMKLAGLEKAPDGFTLKVMDQIRHETEQKHVSYTPLIRRRGWFIITLFSLLFILLLWYSSKTNPAGNGLLSNYLPDLNWQKYTGQIFLSIIEKGSRYGIYIFGGLAATTLLVLDRMFTGKLRSILKT